MMKKNRTLRRLTDLLLIVLLPVLMLECLTGQEVHEWLGTFMLVLFLVHHLLNAGWWRNLFRGTFSPARSLRTALNLLLLADVLTLGISGIWMSGFVFAFLPLSGGMVLARQLHLFSSYWGLILLSAHLGLHMEQILAAIRKKSGTTEPGGARTWVPRAAVILVSAFGIYAFFSQHLPDYLLLRTHFVLFDDTKGVVRYLLETISMVVLFAAAAYGLDRLLRGAAGKPGPAWKGLSFAVPALACILIFSILSRPSQANPWQGSPAGSASGSSSGISSPVQNPAPAASEAAGSASSAAVPVEDGFVLVPGGSFSMGSPEDEPWRSDDETLHTVAVSSFFISPFEVGQSEYASVMGANPSSFSGDDLPVENVSWLNAIAYCNARSEAEGLTPVYTVNGETVSWDRSANGYRLPTEAEWEYACRAGTATPFNTEAYISAEEANFYGTYPYEIENNYFSQGNLDVKPGVYRQTTVSVDSFSPNAWGLYNMHGNVSEWVWDAYGAYSPENASDPAGPETGTRRVYRGGGWNDFAKNLRSAYRAALPQDQGSFNLGIRLVRNADAGTGTVSSTGTPGTSAGNGKMLIAFYSWGGNTRGIAEEIQAQTGADLFEILPDPPYSTDYNTVLDQAQHDQNIQARPNLKNHVEDFEQYDTILLGYPNWWASIPMPIASFLEEYDFAGRTIIPFCYHGGGRFGQSLTAISKLAPDAVLGEPLSIHYSGGSSLSQDISDWLELNRIPVAK